MDVPLAYLLYSESRLPFWPIRRKIRHRESVAIRTDQRINQEPASLLCPSPTVLVLSILCLLESFASCRVCKTGQNGSQTSSSAQTQSSPSVNSLSCPPRLQASPGSSVSLSRDYCALNPWPQCRAKPPALRAHQHQHQPLRAGS